MRGFVIAMPCEADAVRSCLRPDDVLVVCGIGKVNAAAATQNLIDRGATCIVNAGLCGGFGEGLAVGDVAFVRSAVEYDFDLADLNGTCVGQLEERSSPFIPCAVPDGEDASAARILATGDHFNDSADDVPLFNALGCTLRDMEGAAIAHVCEKNGVPCTLAKCVCDVYGGGSMTGQYVDFKERCLGSLRAFAKEKLS